MLGEDGERLRFAAGFLLRMQVQMGDMRVREQLRRQERQRGSAANHLEGTPAAQGLSRFLAWRTCHCE